MASGVASWRSSLVAIVASGAAILSLSTPALGAAEEPAGVATLIPACVDRPSEATASALAAAVSATPTPAAEIGEIPRVEPHVVPTQDGQALRMETRTTIFRQWTFAGGRSALIYSEEDHIETPVDARTGRQLGAAETRHKRICWVGLPTASGRARFENVGGMIGRPFNVLLSTDRRRISFYVHRPFEGERSVDMEFDTPLDLGVADGPDMAVWVLDAPGVIANDDSGQYPAMSTTREILAAALDRPATVMISGSLYDGAEPAPRH